MKNLSLYIDLAFCLVVLPLMALIFPVERWFHNFSHYVVSVGVWLYVLYALNRFVTVPRLFGSRRRVLTAVALIAASFAVTYAFSSVTLYTPRPNPRDEGVVRVLPAVQQYQQAVWSLFMIVETFSFAVGLLTQANLQRARRREVEAERDKARIALYKAQIKPHFLFNTLNSLYGLFLTSSPRALESLEKFISMIRYVHTASERDTVPLDEEASYIREYVGLQSLRLNDMTRVALRISIARGDLPVAPMLLVTFVENCFKYGVSPVERSLIDISLCERDGMLSFTARNHIFADRRPGSGTGIANCRKRLSLLYPGAHSLTVDGTGPDFEVKLTLHLEHDKVHSDRR